MPYRNPLNTEMRNAGRGISCSLNRVGIVLNIFYEIAESCLMLLEVQDSNLCLGNDRGSEDPGSEADHSPRSTVEVSKESAR